MEVIYSLLYILGFMFLISMIVIIPIFVIGMSVHSITSKKKYTPKQRIDQFKEMVILTYIFTFIGFILIGGVNSIKKWWKS